MELQGLVPEIWASFSDSEIKIPDLRERPGTDILGTGTEISHPGTKETGPKFLVPGRNR